MPEVVYADKPDMYSKAAIQPFTSEVKNRLEPALGEFTPNMVNVKYDRDSHRLLLYGAVDHCCDSHPALNMQFQRYQEWVPSTVFYDGWHCGECGEDLHPRVLVEVPIIGADQTTVRSALVGHADEVATYFNRVLRNRVVGRICDEHDRYHKHVKPHVTEFINEWWSRILDDWENNPETTEDGRAKYPLTVESREREWEEEFRGPDTHSHLAGWALGGEGDRDTVPQLRIVHYLVPGPPFYVEDPPAVETVEFLCFDPNPPTMGHPYPVVLGMVEAAWPPLPNNPR